MSSEKSVRVSDPPLAEGFTVGLQVGWRTGDFRFCTFGTIRLICCCSFGLHLRLGCTFGDGVHRFRFQCIFPPSPFRFFCTKTPRFCRFRFFCNFHLGHFVIPASFVLVLGILLYESFDFLRQP